MLIHENHVFSLVNSLRRVICSQWRVTKHYSRGGKVSSRSERWSSSLARRGSMLARASDELQHRQNAELIQNSPNLMVLTLKLIPIIILWIM